MLVTRTGVAVKFGHVETITPKEIRRCNLVINRRITRNLFEQISVEMEPKFEQARREFDQVKSGSKKWMLGDQAADKFSHIHDQDVTMKRKYTKEDIAEAFANVTKWIEETKVVIPAAPVVKTA